jgi:uncharacterized protein YcbX
MGMTIGEVAQLRRYPVKSLGGEQVEHAEIGLRGVHGDRLWAVRDVQRDITATARRLPALLTATARYPEPVPTDAGPGNVPDVEITFPDGTVLSSSDREVDAALSELAGREVRLTALPPAHDTSLHRLHRDNQTDAMSSSSLRADFGVAEGDKLPDLSMIPIADILTLGRYSTPPGTFVDLAPVHVLTTTSLATIGAEVGDELDVRRFRPNLVVALDHPDNELPEAQWVGGRIVIGEVALKVSMQTVRCVVPSRAQPGLEVNRQVTRAVAAKALRCLGVYCGVERAGTVGVGDRLAVSSVTSSRPRRVLDSAARRTKRFAFGAATAAADRLSR